jgi:hypothetical protein
VTFAPAIISIERLPEVRVLDPFLLWKVDPAAAMTQNGAKRRFSAYMVWI